MPHKPSLTFTVSETEWTNSIQTGVYASLGVCEHFPKDMWVWRVLKEWIPRPSTTTCTLPWIYLLEKALVVEIFPFPHPLVASLPLYKTKAYLTPIPSLTMAWCSARAPNKGTIWYPFIDPLPSQSICLRVRKDRVVVKNLSSGASESVCGSSFCDLEEPFKPFQP